MKKDKRKRLKGRLNSLVKRWSKSWRLLKGCSNENIQECFIIRFIDRFLYYNNDNFVFKNMYQ